ncbi:hypothetical protein BLA29_002094, partial [Euroglyphus maynei]
QIFHNLITTEDPLISTNNNDVANSTISTYLNDRRSKSTTNSILSSRLRRHSLDQILSDGIRVCDVERVYQYQNEIFDRCCCIRTIPLGTTINNESTIIRDEDLLFIQICPLIRINVVKREIRNYILRNASLLINDRLRRMGVQNVEKKLFSKTVTTIVLIHRPTGRLLAVLSFDFHQKQNLSELIFLVVTSRYQRRGYGSMLLSIMVQQVIPCCSQYAVHADLGAIDFYKRIGFIEETNKREINRLEKFMGQYDGSKLMRANHTTMMQKLRPLPSKNELISFEDIRPIRSNCPIHVGISQTLSSSTTASTPNDRIDDISKEQLESFFHTIREHFAPLFVATKNDRDSLAKTRRRTIQLMTYRQLIIYQLLDLSIMNIDLLRLVYYRLLWFINHCQWKYRRDDRQNIARKAECHLKRLFVFKFGFEEMF